MVSIAMISIHIFIQIEEVLSIIMSLLIYSFTHLFIILIITSLTPSFLSACSSRLCSIYATCHSILPLFSFDILKVLRYAHLCHLYYVCLHFHSSFWSFMIVILWIQVWMTLHLNNHPEIILLIIRPMLVFIKPSSWIISNWGIRTALVIFSYLILRFVLSWFPFYTWWPCV